MTPTEPRDSRVTARVRQGERDGSAVGPVATRTAGRAGPSLVFGLGHLRIVRGVGLRRPGLASQSCTLTEGRRFSAEDWDDVSLQCCRSPSLPVARRQSSSQLQMAASPSFGVFQSTGGAAQCCRLGELASGVVLLWSTMTPSMRAAASSPAVPDGWLAAGGS